MKVKTKLTLVAVLVALGVISLITFTILAGATGIITTIEEVLAEPERFAETFIKLEGDLVLSSVQYDMQKTELYFEITDGVNNLPVVYYDVTPDNFDDDTEVIVYGYYTAGEPFRAERLETRCPSKYEEDITEEM